MRIRIQEVSYNEDPDPGGISYNEDPDPGGFL